MGFEGFKIFADDVANEPSFAQAALLGETYKGVVNSSAYHWVLSVCEVATELGTFGFVKVDVFVVVRIVCGDEPDGSSS